MTRHKTLSSLSIAATTIFLAAIPCFAQTRPDESNAATTETAAITIIQPALAMNRDLAPKRVAVPKKSDPRASQPSLSASMFKQSTNQFSTTANPGFVTSQKTSFEPGPDFSKQRFSADENNGPAPRPRITFVPSKGQKLPN